MPELCHDSSLSGYTPLVPAWGAYEVKDFTDNEKFIETWNNSTDIIDILKLITLHNVKFETYVDEKFISLDDDYRKLWHIEKEI